MDRNYQIAFVALLTLAITGCTIPEANVPTPPTEPISTEPPAAEPPTKVEPSSILSPPGNASATPNLIPTTNAKERELIVSKGRVDPFGQILEQRFSPIPPGNQSPRPVPPIPPLPQPTPTGGGRQAQTPVESLTTPTPSPPAPKPTPANQDTSSVRPAPLPPVIPDPGLQAVLPPPPQPDLAKAVMVSGVVLIGQKPQAIIKVPTEETSRYVQVGQRLSSGLLIKRIEMNQGSDPIVVLEQYGIEVARMVGEEPVNAASSDPNVEAS